MLNLLEDVGFAVGPMDLRNTRLLIDRRCVIVFVKELVGKCEFVYRFGLRFYSKVVVACVVPCTDVQAGDMLTRFKLRQRGSALVVTVKMIVVHRRHCRIIHMTQAVPYPVVIPYLHVTHLDRKKVFERGLPHICREDTFLDFKFIRFTRAITHFVKPLFCNVAEVES